MASPNRAMSTHVSAPDSVAHNAISKTSGRSWLCALPVRGSARSAKHARNRSIPPLPNRSGGRLSRSQTQKILQISNANSPVRTPHQADIPGVLRHAAGILRSWRLRSFLPDDLKELGQSATATTLFASNILFWHRSGYFDAPAEPNALLHTWSLAVEEQFYIVFPLVLLFLVRRQSNCVVYVAAALLISFALAAWGVRDAPVTTFYLAPTRAWELLLGALLAMGAAPPPSRQGLRDLLSLFGVGLIAYSVLAFSPETPFPGAAALLPCLGAGLVIYAGAGGSSLAGRILGAPAFVFTGLISYSLYLWHWPLLVLARAYAVRELTVLETIAVLALSAVIAALSWRWIENPFRRKPPVLGRQQLFTAAGLVMCVTATLGVGLHLTDGLPQRLPPEAARLAAGAGDRNRNRGDCLNEPVKLVEDGRLCRIGAAGKARPTFVL